MRAVSSLTRAAFVPHGRPSKAGKLRAVVRKPLRGAFLTDSKSGAVFSGIELRASR